VSRDTFLQSHPSDGFFINKIFSEKFKIKLTAKNSICLDE
jgi:hypothetical protein